MTAPEHNRPTGIVIFGGTGNLAETKLLPALFHLYIQGLLPDEFAVVALSRKTLSDAEYRVFADKWIRAKSPKADRAALGAFLARLRYVPGSFDEPEAYERIKGSLAEFDASIGQCTNKLFYLAVPPTLYGGIFANLKTSDAMALCDGVESWSRLLVEKPFGSDLRTAQELERQLCELFSEDQIYRIDHYLAKESIENVLALRFANSILADSWNGEKIESIDLRLHEAQDVSTRGAFYDGIGALRDVGQNHMLQMLALLTMHRVDLRSAREVRDARLTALRSLRMYNTDVRVRAQYEGYREIPGVAPGSETETYFRLEARLDSELWKNVRVSLEAGKALERSFADATIVFRPTDSVLGGGGDGPGARKNVLTISFSPIESVRLRMWVKEPGFALKLHERELVLAEEKGEAFRSPEAYERVLYDCIIGDQTRFVSGPEIEAAWNFIMPVLDSFRSAPLHTYPKGSIPIINASSSSSI